MNERLYLKRVTQLVYTNLPWGPPKAMHTYTTNTNTNN